MLYLIYNTILIIVLFCLYTEYAWCFNYELDFCDLALIFSQCNILKQTKQWDVPGLKECYLRLQVFAAVLSIFLCLHCHVMEWWFTAAIYFLNNAVWKILCFLFLGFCFCSCYIQIECCIRCRSTGRKMEFYELWKLNL